MTTRGGEHAPGVLRGVVVSTWRAVQLARLAEAALLGATALGLALAAAVLSTPRGEPFAWPHLWGAAVVCALAGSLSWWIEHRSRPEDVAARLDRRLRFDGALVTAYELERDLHDGAARPTGIGRLLVQRTARRATRRDALRVALPRSGPFLAPPLIAAGLLAAALEEHRTPPASVPASALYAGLAGEAAVLGAGATRDLEAGDLTAEEVRAAQRLAARAGRLELLAAREEDAATLDRLADEAGALRAELEELAERLPPDSRTARAAERAAGWADLAADRGAASGDAGDAAIDPAGDPAGDFSASANPEVAAGAADGTMSGSSPPSSTAGDASDPAASPVAREGERGVAAVRWWPERYDGVVERWVEARRARAESR